MKHSAIAGLFITAALLASPVFAADKDLCATNIQQVQSFVDSAPSIPSEKLDNVKDALDKAKAAQAAGNDKDCIAIAEGMWEKIQIRNPARN